MGTNATVALSDEFLTAYARLPRNVQRRMSAFITKFQNDPTQPGINYEKIACADEGMCSVRVDDTYRAVVLREKGTGVYLLLWVDHHDEAYDWARRRRCAVNRRTGTLQVYATDRVEAAAAACEPAAGEGQVGGAAGGHGGPAGVPAAAEDGARGAAGGAAGGCGAAPVAGQAVPADEHAALGSALPSYPFARYADDQLLDLGVPQELLAFVHGLGGVDALAAARADLPRDAYENLEFLAHDLPYGEVLDMYRSSVGSGDADAACAPAVPATIADSLANDVSKGAFYVVEGEFELQRVLDAPLEQWRVFLHPSQRKLVERRFAGPARVLGGAGTGKTVVAMHRARRLASTLANPREKVLFTTYTKNLASDIEQNLRQICTTEELRRIEVTNLDAWVSQFLRSRGYGYSIMYSEHKLEEYWETAIARCGVDDVRGASFYAEEWRQVICDQDISTWEEYAHARRVGRGVRLNRKERADVWKVASEYREVLRENKVRDVESAYCDARVLLAGMADAPLYRHVVVDEGQDLSRAAYRVIRALAGQEKPDDIFIVGDAHQRIYGRQLPLSGCGIDIRGRGSKLKVNYRTTDEIKRRAEAVLVGIEYDDLDGGVDLDGASTSLTHGQAPTFTRYGDAAKEARAVTEKVRELVAGGVEAKDICVVARINDRVDKLRALVAQAGVPGVKLEARGNDDRAQDGVRFASMHRVKGLEFDYVFIASVDEGLVPPAPALSQARAEGTEDDLLIGERNLLYVAMTRARRAVFVSSSGVPSGLVRWE